LNDYRRCATNAPIKFSRHEIAGRYDRIPHVHFNPSNAAYMSYVNQTRFKLPKSGSSCAQQNGRVTVKTPEVGAEASASCRLRSDRARRE
jgi:hypothetical protein